MFLSIYCYERLFAVTDVSMNANRTNWRGQLADKVQIKGNIVNFRQGMYCEKISSRFWEIYHLIECHISLWPDFALSTVFFNLCFYVCQAEKPARLIGWLGSCESKCCLLCREKVSWKNFEPFKRNITSKIVMSWKLLPKFRQITWFCYLCFCGHQADKPARPIGWLGSGEQKYCLLGAAKVLWKKFEPFWRNVTSKIVFWCMYLSICCYEQLFAVTDVSMNANRTNERGQLAD